MKILRVVSTMDPKAGGVVEAIHQSALALNDQNFQVSVLCFDNPNAYWVTEKQAYQVHALGESKTHYSINWRYFGWLKENASSYDIIILDGLWQFISLGGYVLKLLKVPYAVFIHGMLDPYFNENNGKYLKKLPFWFLIERNILHMAAGVIFTCEEEARLAPKSFPYFKADVQISTLGVGDIKEFSPKEENKFKDKYPLFHQRKVILFLSRIDPKKGIEVLIEAIASIDNQLSDDYVFAIAGAGATEYKSALTEQISQLNLEQRFSWLGMLSGDSKWLAFSNADAFILPSHQENFGIVVAESLSASTPVLISNKVNIWPSIADKNAGIVCDDVAGDVAESIIQWVSKSDEQKSIMRCSALACFEQYFTRDIAAEQLKSVLRNMVKKV